MGQEGSEKGSRQGNKEVKRSLCKPLALYLVVLIALGLAAWQQPLSWLSPVAMLVLLLGVTWMWRAEGRSIRELGLYRLSWWRRSSAKGLAIGLLLPIGMLSVEALSGFISLTPVPQPQARLARALPSVFVRTALMVAVEELVFRGYMLQRLGLVRGMPLAMGSSSLLWAMLHLPSMMASGLSLSSILAGLMTFTAWGIVLALGLLRSGGMLWFPLALHYGYNLAFSISGTLATIRYDAPMWLVGHPSWAPESGLVGVSFWLTTLLLVWWRLDTNGKTGV